MSKELCFVIDQISREKGISRDALLNVLEAALLSAVRKKFGGRTNIDLRISPKNCDIEVFETKQVVESAVN
ncbi:MAG: transcription termination/antitermination protein NusA, partial [Nitrospirae bacterium]|nr:transcription termination/antitermination protein NusA [Nitrospirota bacterium]